MTPGCGLPECGSGQGAALTSPHPAAGRPENRTATSPCDRERRSHDVLFASVPADAD